LLEILRTYKTRCIVIFITSDKVYKNIETKKPYNENSVLGGYDPYSCSKSSADLAIQSYIQSYFIKKKKIKIAIARAGNVVGGGDWSSDRLIPDCVKSWSKNRAVTIRNPSSTRPWQHVLEVIRGYLQSAIIIKPNKKLNGEAFNFGPNNNQNKTVTKTVK
jgi:CDP-glucose 4,6-dehydratase